MGQPQQRIEEDESCPACGQVILETEVGPVRVPLCQGCGLVVALPDALEALGEALAAQPALLHDQSFPGTGTDPREGSLCPCGGEVHIADDAPLRICASCYRRLVPWSELGALAREPASARLGPLPPVHPTAVDGIVGSAVALGLAALFALAGAWLLTDALSTWNAVGAPLDAWGHIKVATEMTFHGHATSAPDPAQALREAWGGGGLLVAGLVLAVRVFLR